MPRARIERARGGSSRRHRLRTSRNGLEPRDRDSRHLARIQPQRAYERCVGGQRRRITSDLFGRWRRIPGLLQLGDRYGFCLRGDGARRRERGRPGRAARARWASTPGRFRASSSMAPPSPLSLRQTRFRSCANPSPQTASPHCVQGPRRRASDELWCAPSEGGHSYTRSRCGPRPRCRHARATRNRRAGTRIVRWRVWHLPPTH